MKSSKLPIIIFVLLGLSIIAFQYTQNAKLKKELKAQNSKEIGSSGEGSLTLAGTGKGVSVLEVIKATEKISNKKINYNISNRREGDPDVVIASAKKAEKFINWSPKKSDLKTIISSTWEMYDI